MCLDGSEVFNQEDRLARSSVIWYHGLVHQSVFSARRWNDEASSHICQLPQGLLSIYNPTGWLQQ